MSGYPPNNPSYPPQQAPGAQGGSYPQYAAPPVQQQIPPPGQPYDSSYQVQAPPPQQGMTAPWIANLQVMERPPDYTPKPDTPPGLELLGVVDKLYIKQFVDYIEAITLGCYEQQNKYVAFNEQGQQVYLAEEKSGCCVRVCCDQYRPFTLSIKDNNDRKVVELKRPFAGCCLCRLPFCGCRENMEVYANEELIGRVHQKGCGGCLRPELIVSSADYKEEAVISGPFLCIGGCCDTNFKIKEPEGDGEIGYVLKKEQGVLQALLTDADSFNLVWNNIQKQPTPRQKANMLAAVFLIDFLLFEDGAPIGNHAQCQVTCCYLYCCGVVCPCSLKLNNDSNN